MNTKNISPFCTKIKICFYFLPVRVELLLLLLLLLPLAHLVFEVVASSLLDFESISAWLTVNLTSFLGVLELAAWTSIKLVCSSFFLEIFVLDPLPVFSINDVEVSLRFDTSSIRFKELELLTETSGMSKSISVNGGLAGLGDGNMGIGE